MHVSDSPHFVQTIIILVLCSICTCFQQLHRYLGSDSWGHGFGKSRRSQNTPGATAGKHSFIIYRFVLNYHAYFKKNSFLVLYFFLFFFLEIFEKAYLRNVNHVQE